MPVSFTISEAPVAVLSTIPPVGPVSYGWIASDLNPEGVVGEAARATAEKGRRTAEHQVRGLVDMLQALREAPLPGS